MGLLRDDTQREIARLRLEGYENTEIAEKTGVSLRSVERKLKLIRETWEATLAGGNGGGSRQDFR